MFGLTGLRLYGALAALLALAAFIGWIVRIDHLRAEWRTKFLTRTAEAGKVLASIRIASENPDLKWADAADQVEALGASRVAWRGTARLQSQRLDELASETERLKALNAELRRKAEAAIAKRRDAIKRLEDRSLTPGERSDCARQLREAVEALDIVWQEGL